MYKETELSTRGHWGHQSAMLDSTYAPDQVLGARGMPGHQEYTHPATAPKQTKRHWLDQWAPVYTRLKALFREPEFSATDWSDTALEGRLQTLEELVRAQFNQIERLGRLRQLICPAVAEAVLNADDEPYYQRCHRQIATVCCDLRGFTAFAEKAGADEAVILLRDYHRQVVTLINEHGATIDHFAGDGVLAFLNAPSECEHPAERAAELAVGLRERMRRQTRVWKSRGFELGFGIGVTFGPASVGLIGHRPFFDYAATGPTVNLASRLCDKAKDGQILICTDMMKQICDSRLIEFIGVLDIKGFSEPIPVHNISDPALN